MQNIDSTDKKIKTNYRKIVVLLIFFLLIGLGAYAIYTELVITRWVIPSDEITTILLHPGQSETFDTSSTYFNWTSTGGDYGPYNSVLYIDNDVNFASPFLRTIDVGTNENHTPASFMDGKYYWRVEATDGTVVNISDTWNFTILTIPLNNFPSLNNPELEPTSGDTTTVFTYTVNYTDIDNNSASYVNVTIDGTNYSMTETDPSDTNKSDGKQYQYTTTLSEGWHNYSFTCSDGIAINSTQTYTNPEVTVNKNPPTISNPNPSNNSENNSISLTSLTILLNDTDGHTMNWTIETNPDIGNSNANDENNGTKTCDISGLKYNTTYTWWVNVSDIYNISNATFYFKTMTKPYFTITDIYPGNNSYNIQLQPYLYATINHSNGSSFNIKWYYSTIQNNINALLGNETCTGNNTYNQLFLQAKNRSMRYYWRIQLDDGTHYHNESFRFHTEGYAGASVYIPNSNIYGIMGIFGMIGIIGLIVVMLNNQRKNRMEGEYYNQYYRRRR